MAKKTESADNPYDGLTAQDQMAVHADKAAEDDAKRVEDADETKVQYIGYEEALKNYEARSDVEPLEQRRAREVGASFEDARFRRTGDGSAAVVTTDKDDASK